MKVNDDMVDKIARLSKLAFDQGEKEAIKDDLNKMLSLIEKLNEIDTTDIEPLVYITEEENRYRADMAEESLTQKEALKNAPLHDSDYFKVPKVLSGQKD